MTERLQKIIAASGLTSRRKAEELISAGKVTVNGVRAGLGDKADPELDEILVNGRPIPVGGEKVYIMLNKPKGFVTTLHDDKDRRCVTELVKDAGTRLYPVGRLDMFSEGLLLMTNDGEFANKVMHPSHNITKTYETTVHGEDVGYAVERMRQPMAIDDVIVRAQGVDIVSLDGNNAVLHVKIGEGRNREVRKMCDAVGLKVERLRRIREGNLELGDLKPGKWRHLTPREVAALMKQR